MTLEVLKTQNLIGRPELDFLQDRRVTFVPFAGADPDDKVVIVVRVEPGFLFTGGILSETKGRITNPPE